MNAAIERRSLVVWLALSVITLASSWMGSGDDRDILTPNALVASGAIAIALVKTRIIFREFMEVRHAPVLLRRLTDAWLLLTGVTVLGTYFGVLAFSLR